MRSLLYAVLTTPARADSRLKLSMKKGSTYPHGEGVLGEALARNELGETHFGQALTEVGEGLANISEAKDELVRTHYFNVQ